MKARLVLLSTICCLVVAVCGCAGNAIGTETPMITPSTIASSSGTASQAPTTTVTQSEPMQLELAGTWNYSTLAAWDEIPDYSWQDYSQDAITVNVTNISGKYYLVLSFHPNGRERENSLIVIYDIADPSSPEFVSAVAHPEQEGVKCIVYDVAIEDGILYAGLFGDDGLWLVDISDPTSPVDLGILPIPAFENILVAGDYLYATSMSSYNDIVICDISGVPDIEVLGWIDLPYTDGRLVIRGNLLFAGVRDLLLIYDVSSPDNPVKITEYKLAWPFPPASIQDIQAAGNYVYIIFGEGGVRVIDVADPTAPREVAIDILSGFAIALMLKDNLLYVTMTQYEVMKKELAVVDVSEPEKPMLMGSIATQTRVSFSKL